MTDSGTIQEKDTLSTPKTGEEYFDLMNAAVSKGDTEEVNRLMTLEWNPDPDAEKVETKEPPAVEETAVVETKVETGTEAKEEPPVSQTTVVAEQPQARVPVQEQKVDTPEEKLAKLEPELQRLRSDAGRVGHLQSRLAQLERQLQLKDVVAKVKTPPAATEKTDLEKKIEEKIKNLKDVDSDTAELLEAIRAEARQAAQQQASQAAETLTETITQQDEEAYLRQEFNKVIEVHPEFDSIRKHVYWARWKDSLTPEQRAWAESDNASQVIAAVGEFKKQMAAYAQPAAPAVVTPPVVTPPVVTEPVIDATKQAREQRLNASTTSKDIAIKNNGVVDAEAMFSEMYNQVLKDSGQIK